MNCALTIAGSDSGGGAGIQADLKTFEAFGIFGLSVITALTAQNTLSVNAVLPISPDFVLKQAEAVFEDFQIPAVKTGMLVNAEIITNIAHFLSKTTSSLVVDPVMVATSGQRLLEAHAIRVLNDELLPLARVITPNIDEAEVLCGMKIKTREDVLLAGNILVKRYPNAYMIIKGGHLSEARSSGIVQDFIFYENKTEILESPFRPDIRTHGTGCTFSAAITAGLASGISIRDSIYAAKKYISRAIAEAPVGIGKGSTPLRHSPL